jgi:hypothetical protein
MKKTRLNQLEYLKKYLVWFGFGFISLKLKNRTEKIKKSNKKKPNQTETKPIRKSENAPKNNIVFGFSYKITKPNLTIPKSNRTEPKSGWVLIFNIK